MSRQYSNLYNMCGIWALLTKESLFNKNILNYYESFMKIQNRGPDYSDFRLLNLKTIIGFHRLAMVDVTDRGNQPFELESDNYKYHLICNGEIYNYLELIHTHKLNIKSGSDCEVILHLYIKYGLEKAIELLKGVFSLIIHQENKKTNKRFLLVANDRIGVRPLFYTFNDTTFGISSEMKGLSDLFDKVYRFPPGHYIELDLDNMHLTKFSCYYNYIYPTINHSLDEIYLNIQNLFYKAVEKRILQSDRPVCALLSGGLDSSIVAAIANDVIKKKDPLQKLKTFTIGFKDATDIKYAEMVAKYIDSDHTTIIVNEDEFIQTIDKVIYAIESHDITTIRASVGQFKVAEYIRNNTDYKCVLCGDGSDELLGGYIYFHSCPTLEDFHQECVRLIKDIHLYDSLRADRAISYHGLELRVPFLDQDFVNYYLSLPVELRMPKKGEMEKILFRRAFENKNLIPKQVLFRNKEAFSDGVSSKEKSWYQILQDHINKKTNESESTYYKKIFQSYYHDNYHIIPYIWMPKWCGEINDPSARVLNHYNQNELQINETGL